MSSRLLLSSGPYISLPIAPLSKLMLNVAMALEEELLPLRKRFPKIWVPKVQVELDTDDTGGE